MNVTAAETPSEDPLQRTYAYVPTRVVSSESTRLSLKLRIVLWGLTGLLHIAFIAWIYHEMARSQFNNPEQVITVLEFITKPKPVPVEPVPEPKEPVIKPVESSVAKIKPRIEKPANEKPIMAVEIIKKERPVQTRKTEVRVYDSTGRIKLDPEFVENFDERHNVPTRFDFQNPDLELAGTFLKRPPAMDFEPTQFDQAWKPNQDILTELLEKAVEKTTSEVKIPVPGNPTTKLVCKVSILALGGGCGFVPNGGYGRVIPDTEDDPNTLSPKEQEACQAWWNKIIDTRSQREWFKTKDLYELECKKPFAKEKIKPK